MNEGRKEGRKTNESGVSLSKLEKTKCWKDGVGQNLQYGRNEC